jgi:phosphoribosylaminoimidazolecarboxamide formyltransferase / IMP cyclohydrolase
LPAPLASLGIELISTGGSAATLRKAGLKVTNIDEVTGFPEMMDGRVKTLHPNIHGGILARRDVDGPILALRKIKAIDLVCVNLYPFEQTVAKPGVKLEDAIEHIDIGGPSMIRSAAKNSQWVVCVTSPAQYSQVLDELTSHDGGTSLGFRQKLAVEAFARTARYDAAIESYLSAQTGTEPTHEDESPFPPLLTLGHTKAADLRYGENPHQQAAVYRDPAYTGASVIGATQIHGKPLSYNNVLDASAALTLAIDVGLHDKARTGVVIVKHTNPCGCAVAGSLEVAVQHAIDGDPLAAFGGIVALNRPVDEAAAGVLTQQSTFFEVIVAPSFTDGALAILKERSVNLRLLATGSLDTPTAAGIQIRTLPGGSLAQTTDDLIAVTSTWNHAAGPVPSDSLVRAAAILDSVSRSLTSNAIAIGQCHADGSVMLVGAGAGQMDRVASCRIAVEKAGDRARGGVAVSDAFFPFTDGPEILADAGIALIVHPGGSKRDEETFELCRQRGISCMTTGVRRFRH